MPIVLSPEAGETNIVTSSVGRVWSPEVAALPGGGYVAIWADEDTDFQGWLIMARAFDANGNPISDNFQVGDASANGQYSLDVTALSSDSFMVAYQRWEPAGDNSAYGIVARAFQTDGTPLTSEFLANTGTLNYQDSATITTLSNGNVLIGWTDASGNLGDNGFGAKGAIFEADGTPVTGEFVLASQLLGGQYTPNFAPLANGGFAAVWADSSLWFYGPGSDTDGFALFARTFDASGAPTSAQVRVNQTTAGDQIDQSVTTLSTGGFVVTWTDTSGTTDGDGWAVMARLFGADGLPVTGEFLVNTVTAGDQQSSSVTALDTGGFVVSWYTYGDPADIEARIFDDAGVAQGDQFTLNSTTGVENYPVIAGLDSGRMVAIWMDQTNNPAFELHARTFTAGTNATPLGVGDGYTAIEGVLLDVDAAHGVLANDSDADNDPLSVALGTTAAHGTLTLNADGSFSYTADSGFTGVDSFTYLLSDGHSTTAPVTVTLTVGDDHTIYGTPDIDYITPSTSTLPGGELPTSEDDTIYGYGGPDTLQGGFGNDTLYGGDDRDTLVGDAGNDKLYGEGGDDFLSADDGSDELYGGEGNDRLSIASGRGDAVMAGGDGTDTLVLDFQYVTNGIVFSAPTTDGVLTIPGGTTLTLSGFEAFDIRGTHFDDVLTGSDGSDLLNGNGGNDTLYGGFGDDMVVEDPFVDDYHVSTFYGGDGYDTLTAYFYYADAGVTVDFNGGTGVLSSSLAVVNFHDFEALNIQGSAFADTIIGGAGSDGLFGREGDDVLTGGGQTDVIYGGYDPATDGFDTAVYSGNRADYTITIPDDFTYVSDNRPGSPDGLGDLLYSIERLRFADGDYDWDAASRTYVPAGSGGNQAPVGHADGYVVDEDAILTVNAVAGLLANDTDADNDALHVASYTTAAHGSLLVNANGSFTYTPLANYNGADSFTYTVSDGTVTSGPVTVSLGVTPVNDAPTNFALSIASVPEDTPQWTTLGTFRAQDADGDTLTYSLLDSDGGPFSLRGNRLISNAAFDYETRSSYDIVAAVSDGTTTVQKTFHIDIGDIYEPPANLPPVDLRFSKTAVKENTAIGTSLGLLSATDPEGGTLHWTLLDDANGTFRVVGNKIRITGNIDYETTHQISFTAQVEDNAGNTAQKVFTLDVIDVAEPLHGFAEIPLI